MDYPGTEIKYFKRQNCFTLYFQNKITKDFHTHFRILSMAKFDSQRVIIYYEHKFNALKNYVNQT